MISLDWKQRLQQDTEDFFDRKIPTGDYDLDIVYNAYPKRIEGKIPKEVVVFVAKTLAGKLAKQPERYHDLYRYLWEKKGENGHLALAYILGRVIRRQPEQFLEPIFDGYITKATDSADINLLLDKTIFPLFRDDPAHYLDIIVRWLKVENPSLRKSLIALLVKVCTQQPEIASTAFKKLESTWLYATPEMVKTNSLFLRALAKIDPALYESVFKNYKQTRNPVFVEILSAAIVETSPEIEEAVENWMRSGNARLKKAALAAQKLLQRKKS